MKLRRGLHTILLIGCISVCGCSNVGYPSDRTLSEKFRSCEADFVKLVSLFKEDANLRKLDYESTRSFGDLKTIIPEQRMEEYRGLLTKLGVESLTRNEKSGDIYLLVWSRSHMVIGSKSKSYVYAEKPPEPLVDSLDGLVNGTDALAYKQITRHWYLFLDVW
jgi:hypothetical protein